LPSAPDTLVERAGAGSDVEWVDPRGGGIADKRDQGRQPERPENPLQRRGIAADILQIVDGGLHLAAEVTGSVLRDGREHARHAAGDAAANAVGAGRCARARRERADRSADRIGNVAQAAVSPRRGRPQERGRSNNRHAHRPCDAPPRRHGTPKEPISLDVSAVAGETLHPQPHTTTVGREGRVSRSGTGHFSTLEEAVRRAETVLNGKVTWNVVVGDP
jgi:hypothetical protein